MTEAFPLQFSPFNLFGQFAHEPCNDDVTQSVLGSFGRSINHYIQQSLKLHTHTKPTDAKQTSQLQLTGGRLGISIGLSHAASTPLNKIRIPQSGLPCPVVLDSSLRSLTRTTYCIEQSIDS